MCGSKINITKKRKKERKKPMKSAEKRSSGGGNHPSRSHQQVPSKLFVPGAELNNRWTILQVIGKGNAIHIVERILF